MSADTSPASRYSRITRPEMQVDAAQLVEGADWKAIAEWCGGTLVFNHGEWVIQIPNESDATADDWVVKTLDEPAQVLLWMPGEFKFLYRRVEGGAQ